MSVYAEIIGVISNFMYSKLLIILLLACGLWYTFRTKFVQLRMFGESIRVVTEKPSEKSSVSSFQALMVSTASRVGTGNIVGVATAICLGGYGAVFWMWVIALVGGASAFVESTLAQIYKKRYSDGSGSYGGPAYYIEAALHSRLLAVLFCVFMIATYAVGFNMLASYNLQSTFSVYSFYNPETTPWIIGGVLAVLVCYCLLGGGKRVVKVTSLLVPVMGIVYVLVSLVVTFTHITLLPQVLGRIFRDAFDFRAIFGSFASSCMMYGIKRGLYSNEAGMGSAPNAAATASVSHPVKQGLVQSLSVYIDTLVICTCSAMMVLVFYVQNPAAAEGLNGMPLVQMAVNNAVGEWGIHVITFAIFAFAFSSLIGNYFYAESNLRFIKDGSPVLLTVFRLACIVFIYLGAVNSFDLAWNLADIFMGFMAIMNLIAILLLGKWAIRALDDYTAQRNAGKDPVFVADSIEGLPATQCWHVGEGDLKDVGPEPVKQFWRESIDPEQ